MLIAGPWRLLWRGGCVQKRWSHHLPTSAKVKCSDTLSRKPLKLYLPRSPDKFLNASATEQNPRLWIKRRRRTVQVSFGILLGKESLRAFLVVPEGFRPFVPCCLLVPKAVPASLIPDHFPRTNRIDLGLCPVQSC